MIANGELDPMIIVTLDIRVWNQEDNIEMINEILPLSLRNIILILHQFLN
jgi:hypothetical protein